MFLFRSIRSSPAPSSRASAANRFVPGPERGPQDRDRTDKMPFKRNQVPRRNHNLLGDPR
ncbi:hypothetical protein IL54_0776 [Sphingobium sp. ba1]|nr:hypothetical protein IL54_0776 [Sphingobium sp. ba1]